MSRNRSRPPPFAMAAGVLLAFCITVRMLAYLFRHSIAILVTVAVLLVILTKIKELTQ